MNAVTITFDVANVPGQFAFDTACFTQSLMGISMIDNGFPPAEHGPPGTGECVFEKGVITIVVGSVPCFCGIKGDLNNDRKINLIDVVHLVNYVYRGVNNLVYPENWDCVFQLGDVDCSGDVSSVDIILFINLVFRNQDFMCNPCTEGYDPWGHPCGW
jgi:hypothetical protein